MTTGDGSAGVRTARRVSARKLCAQAAALAVGFATLATASSSASVSPHGWAAELPGCHADHPAVAHLADQQVLDDQPTDGPVPCGTLTGWPTVENRVEVTNDNVVLQEPAILAGGPVLGGSGHMPGWGGPGNGLARTSDGGRKWDAVAVEMNPNVFFWQNMVDSNLYVDHETNRLFFYMMSSGGAASYGGPPKCIVPNGNPATVAFTDDSGTTWNWGFDMDHGCAENPTVLTAEPTVSRDAPESSERYENVVYLCGDNTSTGVGGIGTPGFSCSKSLNGGSVWLGTTLNGQGFYSGIAKDLLAPYPECAGGSSSAGAAVQPLPDGTLVVVMSCGGSSYLSASTDEGATWNVVEQIPHGGTLRADSVGNLFLLEAPRGGTTTLMLSHATYEGDLDWSTWSEPVNMIAPGVTSVSTAMFAQGTHAPGQVGHVAVTYYGNREGYTTSDGFITETRDALDPNPVFWSGQVNDVDRPLLYNTSVNMGVTVLDFLGGALAMDGGSVWGSWVQDCGDNLITDSRCLSRLPAQNPLNPQDGFVGRLVWPPGVTAS